MGVFPQPVFSPDQVAAMQQQMPQLQPASSGYSSDISSPSAMPNVGANAGTNDLETQAAQAPQQLAQSLQNQQQQNQPQQAQQQPGQQSYSPENPHAKLAQYYTQQLMQSQPPTQGGNVKRMLTNFFGGMGAAMQKEAGLQTPDERRQILAHNAATYGQLADQWEQAQSLNKYRAALTDQMTQNRSFQQQLQPIELQRAQLGLTQEQQNMPTVRPVMSSEDLTALGVPSDLAHQYQNTPLSEADMGSLRQMAVAGQRQLFDYGQDGAGPNRGVWLMDRNYVPIKQIATVSETGRSTAIAKIQAQQQNNQIKSATAPVYAFDPNSKQTVLTTAGAAQQGGMQAIRGVKETDIRNDTHDTRVLNDVAVKSNSVLDASAALDQPADQRFIISQALANAEKDDQFRAGAFGTTIPTGWLNNLLNSEQMDHATQLTKDYVVNSLSLREAAMGMQKVLTGSARANEAQINALQATVPGLETNSALARQKLAAFTQNVDMLRQGIPRMPGIDVVPLRSKSGQDALQPGTGGQTQNQQNQSPTLEQSIGMIPGNLRNNYHKVLRGLGIE